MSSIKPLKHNTKNDSSDHNQVVVLSRKICFLLHLSCYQKSKHPIIHLNKKKFKSKCEAKYPI